MIISKSFILITNSVLPSVKRDGGDENRHIFLRRNLGGKWPALLELQSGNYFLNRKFQGFSYFQIHLAPESWMILQRICFTSMHCFVVPHMSSYCFPNFTKEISSASEHPTKDIRLFLIQLFLSPEPISIEVSVAREIIYLNGLCCIYPRKQMGEGFAFNILIESDKMTFFFCFLKEERHSLSIRWKPRRQKRLKVTAVSKNSSRLYILNFYPLYSDSPSSFPSS